MLPNYRKVSEELGIGECPVGSISCAQCGAPIIVALWAEYVSEHRVRNLWSCDTCGYQFETEVYFAAQRRHDRSVTSGVDGPEGASLR